MHKIISLLLILIIFTPSGAIAQSDPTSITLTETAVLGRGTIQELEWRPDGEMLAVGSSSGVWLFDADFEPISHFESGFIRRMAWEPNGERLAFSTADGQIFIWQISADGTQYEELQTLSPPNADLNLWLDVSWSPDGERLAITNPPDDGIEIWDTQTGDIVLQVYDAMSVHWSPDGNTLVGPFSDNSAVGIWDAATGELLHRFVGVEDYLYFTNAVFSPDGTKIVGVTSFPASIHLWNAASGELINEPDTGADSAGFQTILWHPDTDQIAFLSGRYYDDRRSLALWDTVRFDYIDVPYFANGIRAIDWTPDGSALTIGTVGGTIHQWTLGAESTIEHLLFSTRYSEIGWSPDGSILATSGFGTDVPVMLWNMDDIQGEVFESRFAYLETHLRTLNWTPDGRFLITITSNNPIGGSIYIVHQWDVLNGGEPRRLVTMAHQFASIPAEDWSSDLERFAVSWNGNPNVDVRASMESGNEFELPTSTEVISQVGWSPDDSRLATFGGSYDGDDLLLELWETDEGERLSSTEFFAPNDNRWRAEFAWSLDGNSVSVMIADADNEIYTLYVVNADSGDVRFSREFYPYNDPTISRQSYDMSWGGDNRLTIIVPEVIGKSVTILDGASGEETAYLEFENVTGLSWHPDYDIFVLTTRDSLNFYNGANGDLITTASFSGRVDDTSWSPDSTRLALFGYDERIHLWDVEIE